MKNSINFHNISKIKIGENEPKITPSEEWPKEWKEIIFKQYPRFEKIRLPKLDLPKITLQRSLEERESRRYYSNEPIKINDLGSLFFWSAGLIRMENDNLNKSRRFYPSGGARYPLEIYLAVLAESDEIREGLYHYNVVEHSLEKLIAGNFRSEFFTATIKQEMVKKAPLIILISSVFFRAQNKYKDRGYRYILLEAGHLCQNLLLTLTVLGIKSCAIGGFDDDFCNQLLDLDGEKESVIYLLSCGY